MPPVQSETSLQRLSLRLRVTLPSQSPFHPNASPRSLEHPPRLSGDPKPVLFALTRLFEVCLPELERTSLNPSLHVSPRLGWPPQTWRPHASLYPRFRILGRPGAGPGPGTDGALVLVEVDLRPGRPDSVCD